MSTSSLPEISLVVGEIDKRLEDCQRSMKEACGALREILAKTQNASLRGKVNQRLWDCRSALGECTGFYSQFGQDEFLAHGVFKGKRGGTFLEIGGYDGVFASNCLYLEQRLGWTGAIVEPVPKLAEQIRINRSSPCLEVALAAEAGEQAFLEIQSGYLQMSGLASTYDQALLKQVQSDDRYRGQTVSVKTVGFEELLKQADLSEVDLISLDIEGAELDALKGFPFDKVRVGAWCIENNSEKSDIAHLLASKGYQLIERLGVDDVYVPMHVVGNGDGQ